MFSYARFMQATLYTACVQSVTLYSNETWPLKNNNKQFIVHNILQLLWLWKGQLAETINSACPHSVKKHYTKQTPAKDYNVIV